MKHDFPPEASDHLPPDQAAWLPVARRILLGEFDGCDRFTRESLTSGLRSVRYRDCERALARITGAALTP